MREIKLKYSSSQISEGEIQKLGRKIQTEISNMINASKKEYQDDRASINLPFDQQNLEKIKNLIKKKTEIKSKIPNSCRYRGK